MKSKSRPSIALVSLLAIALAVPMATSGATTLTINAPTLPSGHEEHTPLLDGGFWLNTGALASPVWTYYPWGSTVYPTPGTPNEFDIKIPAVIRDSEGGNPMNGHVHTFKIAEWPNVTVISGPEAEPSQGVIEVPTYRWRLDPASPAVTTPKLARAGPQIDVLRYRVMSPESAVVAMQNGEAHAFTQITRQWIIEKLELEGFTITFPLGFHVCFFGFNVRANQTYRRPEVPVGEWPLADVNFRHALIHCFPQEQIIAQTYRYMVAPIQSLVPPAQGGWLNPNVPKHPFAPGNPFTSTPGDGTSCGVLMAAGYTFVDADDSRSVTLPDYWKNPHGYPLWTMRILTPTYEVDPQKFVMVGSWTDIYDCFRTSWMKELCKIGLAATPYNEGRGLMREPIEFFQIIADLVYDYQDFDVFVVDFKLNRFPDHLYDWFHSSQDLCEAYNAFGVCDRGLNYLTETLKFSLDHAEKFEACWAAQERLTDPERSCALPTIPVYTMNYFDAYNSDLRGIVKSNGFGSDGGGCLALKDPDGPTTSAWTHLNIHWAPGTERFTPDGRTLLNWTLGVAIETNFNPLEAGAVPTWEIMDRVYDPLMIVNPYSHEDLPWLAESWEVTTTEQGMDVTYQLRRDLFWQDGNPYTANDAEFSLEFLRDNQIPKYKPAWEHIVDVEVIDDHTFTVHADTTSQFLIYDWASLAALLPPPVWSWLDRKPLEEIKGYDPSTNTTKPTGAGPWFGTPQGPATQLYGTGPFVFGASELHQFPGYFRFLDDIHNQKVEMFHECGDVNYDGYIWADDRGQVGVRFGCMGANYIAPGVPPVPDPCYDPNVDINHDGIIDMGDLSLANYFYGEQREYPVP